MWGGKTLDFLMPKLRVFLTYLRGTPLVSWLVLKHRLFEHKLLAFILHIVYDIMDLWFWAMEKEAAWRRSMAKCHFLPTHRRDRLRLACVRLRKRYKWRKKLFFFRLADAYNFCVIMKSLYISCFVEIFESIASLWRR